LNYIREAGERVVAPSIILAEVAAALSRGIRDKEMAFQFVGELARISQFILVPVDRALALRAARTAAQLNLRGCDSIYVQICIDEEVKLVSLDEKQVSRSKVIIEARSPREELSHLGIEVK
jgi:predicted nucleic acid-binding protein